MAKQIYLKCSAKQSDTKYGPMLNIGVKADDLIAFAREHQNARGYVNLTVTARKEPGQFGDTHSVVLDTYEPKKREPVTPADAPVIDDDSIPFAVLLPLVMVGAGLL